jgi:hypothetical protein
MRRSASYALAVLFAINAMNFFDRQIIGAVAGKVEQLPFGDLVTGQVRALFGGPRMSLPAALEPFRGEGLHSAMFIVPTIATVLAVVLFAASRTVKGDVARLKNWMASTAA